VGSAVNGKSHNKKAQATYSALANQIALVMEGIKKYPSRKKEILVRYVSSFYEGVKNTVIKQGSVTPHYVILGDTEDFCGSAVTDEVLGRARDVKAEAVVSVEGFQARNDISDVIYHVSMSAPSMGVLGWVFKVKLADERVDIVCEMPYLFDSQDKVKTLGELVTEMEAGSKR
jgi:hypothetical protein